MVHNFFLCVFKNTGQKNICASIIFKAESKPKHEEHIFWGGFLQKPKPHFFGGLKWYFLKVKFQICISAFVLYVKGSSMPIFTKNINIWAPWNFLKMKTLRRARRNFGIGLLNHAWPLVTWPVLSDQKKVPHSTLLRSRWLCWHTFFANIFAKMKKFAEPILPVHMGPKSCDTVPLRKGGGWGENWGGSRRVFCLLRCAVFVTQREEKIKEIICIV